MKCITNVVLIFATCVGISTRTAMADGPPVEIIRGKFQKPTVVRLVVSPAAAPQPSLKHSLWPIYENQKPGNASPYYYRAVVQSLSNRDRLYKFLREKHGDDFYKKWLNARPEDLPREAVQQLVNHSAVNELRAAVNREYCDWDWRIQDLNGMEAIAFLLPEVQEMRDLARQLSLRAKLQIAEGDVDGAIETLQIGYKMAQDAGRPRTLVNALVGMAIARMFNEVLYEVIALPDSPNLYWALAQLPNPLFDMRQAMQHEMQLPATIFPFLKDPENEHLSTTQWREFMVTAVSDLQDLGGGGPNPFGYLDETKAQLVATVIAMKGYPRAKRELIEMGYDREKLDEMPVGQVIAIHESKLYRHVHHESLKWTLLPYWQAQRGMQATYKKLNDEGYLTRGPNAKEVLPILSTLWPATENAMYYGAQLERELISLRVIEAIRMHAKANGGRFPKTLDEIKVVPVPIDPLSGKAFQYELVEGKAVLSLDTPEGFQQLREPRKYELSVR